MMKISVIVPVIELKSLTVKSLWTFISNASNIDKIDFLIIDNGSEIDDYSTIKDDFKAAVINVLRNKTNIGVYPSLNQGYQNSTGDIVFFTHNDLFINEYGWDFKITRFFSDYPNLGLAGFVGGAGIGTDGGRINTFCTFSGIYGSHYSLHGIYPSQDVTPVCVLDGCALIFRRSVLNEISWDEKIECHHFYDKIMSLDVIYSGYDNAVFKIACDHLGGETSCRTPYQEWAKQHVKNKYGEDTTNGDQFIYSKSEQRLFEKYGDRFPVIVAPDWSRIDKHGVIKRNV